MAGSLFGRLASSRNVLLCAYSSAPVHNVTCEMPDLANPAATDELSWHEWQIPTAAEGNLAGAKAPPVSAILGPMPAQFGAARNVFLVRKLSELICL